MVKITHNAELLGIKFNISKKGFRSFTEEKLSLQISTVLFPGGTTIDPHYHKPIRRITGNLGEAIVVIDGKIRISIFGKNKKLVRKIIIKSGEGFVLYAGGHKLEFLETTRAFELKNGPFIFDRVDF